MDARQQILEAIRRHPVEAVDLPALENGWSTYAERREQFAQTLEAVGGRCVLVESADRLSVELEELPEYRDGQKICSLVEGAGRSTVDLQAVDDPHTLQDVDFAILPALFGVAENAAVWVNDDSLQHRVLYFIVQHLALVLSANQLVDNMHEAYARLKFEGTSFGCFISGPSKTADIEQSLVIGAHGPRSLTVFLVEA